MMDLFIYETNREEQQEVASALNDRAVVDYLLQHPEFLFVMPPGRTSPRPHPVRGTISLVGGT